MADNLESAEANDAEDQNQDGRSEMARGYVVASRVMSIGFQMIIPVGVGWWADSAWKTSPWLMLLGVVLGFVVSMMELMQLARESAPPKKSRLLTGKLVQSGRGGDGLGDGGA
ncbi:MAG: AtpZ/AtpI family protein [Planctomycetales bacterium]|nr:AtpZ/AtpI family protein [Planctomycetales bacterium]